MLTINEAIGNATNINESVLLKLSDRLWTMGNLSEIQENVTPALFNLHVCVNMIGNWQNDG